MATTKAPAVTGEWECTECGYIVEGIELKRPAHCPECDAPADALEFFSYEDGDEDEWDEDDDEESEDDDFDEDDDDGDYEDADEDEYDREEDY